MRSNCTTEAGRAITKQATTDSSSSSSSSRATALGYGKSRSLNWKPEVRIFALLLNFPGSPAGPFRVRPPSLRLPGQGEDSGGSGECSIGVEWIQNRDTYTSFTYPSCAFSFLQPCSLGVTCDEQGNRIGAGGGGGGLGFVKRQVR